MAKKKVVVIGLGYIGLPTLTAITKSRLYESWGYDVDKNKIQRIQDRICPVEDKEVCDYISKNKLKVSANKNVLKNSDIFIICVPTPVFDDYSPNYEYIVSATRLIASYLRIGNQVILESTVNPGTCEEIIKPILEEDSGFKAGKDFNLAHCPERINPGDSNWNIYNINRNVGSINQKGNHTVAEFYRSFITEAKINEVTSLKVAEATKIVENTFRDINIAYVNELAQSFDAMGIDLDETLRASANKPFAFMAHWPGCGVGGHCIAVDPYYLIKRASMDGFDHRFLKLAREINASMPQYTVNRLVKELSKFGIKLKGASVALLGLSYKPDIGDIRESPAVEIRNILIDRGARVLAYDPYINEDGMTSLEMAISESTAVILATAHKEFINRLPKLLHTSKIKVVVDGRNCIEKSLIIKQGIIYRGIGK